MLTDVPASEVLAAKLEGLRLAVAVGAPADALALNWVLLGVYVSALLPVWLTGDGARLVSLDEVLLPSVRVRESAGLGEGARLLSVALGLRVSDRLAVSLRLDVAGLLLNQLGPAL